MSSNVAGGRFFAPIRALFRSSVMGFLWVATAVVVLAFAWQVIAGWPVKTRYRVRTVQAGAVQTFRVPRTSELTEWNYALVRVKEGEKVLPRFPSEEALNAAGSPGFASKARDVYFRPAAADPTRSPVVVEVPWAADPWRIWAVAGAMLVWSLPFILWRNAVVSKALGPLSFEATSPRRPWISLGLGMAVLAAAVLLRVWGFSFPYWFNDTSTYFGSVFNVMAGGRPMATPDRPFAYPLVMGSLLRLVPDLRAIVTAQACASIFAGVVIGVIVWLSGERLFAGRFWRGLSRALGVATLAAFVLNEFIFEREWFLIAEAWVTFYLGVQAALAWYLTARPHPLGKSLGIYAIFCTAGLLAFFSKPNWGFALGLLPLPWVAASWLSSDARRQFLRRGAAGAGVLLVLVIASFGFQKYCTPRTTLGDLYYRARALLCWHVPLVRPEIDRRIQATPPGFDRDVLVDIARAMDEELALSKKTGAGAYPTLGYNADRLFTKGLHEAPVFRKLTPEQRTVLCTSIFKSALQHDPQLYLQKVGREIPTFVKRPYNRPDISTYHLGIALSDSQRRATTEEMIPPEVARRYVATLEQAQQEFARGWPSVPRLTLSNRMSIIFDFLQVSFAPALAVPLLLLGVSLLWPALRRLVWSPGWAPVLWVAIWAAGSSFLSALTSAVTQGLDVHRYVQLSMPLSLLANVLWPLIGMAIVISAGVVWRARKRAEAVSAAGPSTGPVSLPAGTAN